MALAGQQRGRCSRVHLSLVAVPGVKRIIPLTGGILSPKSLASGDLKCSRDLEKDREQPHTLGTRGCEVLFRDLVETI